MPPRPFDDALHDGFLVRPVEPDLVGQVGRAEFVVALAVWPVADARNCRRTSSCRWRDRRRSRPAARTACAHNRPPRKSRSALRMPSRPKAGMLPWWPLSAPERAPWRDRLLDLVERAAPQPIVVVEIGIALRPPPPAPWQGAQLSRRPRAPAARANVEQLRRLCDVASTTPCVEFLVHRPAQGLELGEVADDGAARDASRRCLACSRVSSGQAG